MTKYLTFIKKINIKSIIINFKYLPIKDAIKFPVLISRNVNLLETKGAITINSPIKTGMIQFGYGEIGIFDKKRSKSIWKVSGKLIFNGRANIGHGTKIDVGKDALLEIGDNFKVSAETEIVAQKQIQIGNNVLISWDCLLMDTDFHKIYNKSGDLINASKPIIIGNKVWIGCRCIILKGSKISNGSIIGANSSLSKDISDLTGIFAGNPIKFIKGDVTWEK